MSELINPLQGQTIRGYHLEHLLGQGALTAVYHGRTQENWHMPELIITIFLLPDNLTHQVHTRFHERFAEEARQMVMLRHPHLLPVYGYGKHATYPYLFTPNTSGTLLSVRLREQRRWTPTEVMSLLAPLATALDYIHAQGLVCQFLNPNNILIQDDTTVLLTGIGLPHLLSVQGLEYGASADPYAHLQSIAGTYLGAPQYLAPETIQGTGIDNRADIYSLGILVFELLSGHPPFTGNSFREVVQKHIREPLPSLHETCTDLPLALEIALNRALHRNPLRRYQKASDFATAFAQAIDGYYNTPRSLALLRTVEQIRALPAPPPSLTLMLPSPQQAQKPVASSWPYALLTDLQANQPQLPAGLTQSTAERLASQIRQDAEELIREDDQEETGEFEHDLTLQLDMWSSASQTQAEAPHTKDHWSELLEELDPDATLHGNTTLPFEPETDPVLFTNNSGPVSQPSQAPVQPPAPSPSQPVPNTKQTTYQPVPLSAERIEETQPRITATTPIEPRPATSNGHPKTPVSAPDTTHSNQQGATARNDFNAMSRELREKRERLQRQSRSDDYALSENHARYAQSSQNNERASHEETYYQH